MPASQSQRPYVGEDGNLRFYCDACGRKLKVPPRAVGRKVKCSSCERVLSVPPLPDAEPEVEFDADDPLGALEGLAGGEAIALAPPVDLPPLGSDAGSARGAAGSAARGAGAAAGGPGSLMPRGLGGSAGRRAGVAGPAAGWAGDMTAGSARDDEAGGLRLPGLHPLLRGLIGCVLGTTLGAALWVVIAVQTGYELGYVAWAVGLAAGFGMYLGSRGPSLPGALLAGTLAGLGIVVAKAVIVRMMLEGAEDVPLWLLMFAVVRLSDPLDFLFYALAIGTAFYRAVKGADE